MDRRFVIFILASIVILYFSNYLVVKNAKNRTTFTETKQIVEKNEKKELKTDESLKKQTDIVIKKDSEKDIKIVNFDNGLIEISASSLGAKLNKVIIRRLGFENEAINIVDEHSYNEYITFNATINGKNLDLNKRNWSIRKQANGIQFYIEPITNLFISKTIIFNPNAYTGMLKIDIKNKTTNSIEIENAKLNWGPGKNSGRGRFNIKQVVVLNERKVDRIKTKKKNEKVILPIKNGWAGMRDQYFCALFYGVPGTFNSSEITKNDDQTLILSLNLPTRLVQPKSDAHYEIKTYFGPQNYQKLKKEGYNLHKVVDFGMFHFIAVPIYYLLKYLYKVTKNYGVAIILLTLIIRIILWWPTQKSYTSMKKMQAAMNKMQPRLKTLKEIYRDNPAKLNEETMKLYKEYQVNPMGGCLPMLLQMPVFFALYSALTSAVELKGAEFIWFWKDLSTKDPMHVLPLLMGLSMFLQQKMSTPPAATPEAAAQQKMMLYLMPAMLTFFSFIWPSGLLLYWVVSNILSIGQQLLINQRA